MKVSGHSSSRPRAPGCGGVAPLAPDVSGATPLRPRMPWTAASAVNRRRASGGIARSGAMPPARFASAPSGPRAAAFSASTARAGSLPTSRSHRGSAPME